MNTLKSNKRQQLLISLIMVAILCMTRMVFAIEPIDTLGQPPPEKHAFLTNETLVGHDKRYLFTNQDGNLQIWDWKTGRTIKFPSSQRYNGLSRDGSYLVSMEKTGQYRIWDAKALFSSLPYSVEPKGKQLVTLGQIKRNQLLQNYPNPFNPETWIPFRLADESPVTIDIYNSTGKLIRTISQGTLKAGDYSSQSNAIHWDGQNDEGESVSSGVYFYTINAGDFSSTRKMLIKK